MFGWKKILWGVATFIMAGLLAAGGWIYHVRSRGLPAYDGQVGLTGLEHPVQILRDSYAMPHIAARSESDLYYAVGYAQAQDRLWQMDLLRRVTQGRLSEIFGQDLVDVDLMMRALRIPDKSRLMMAELTPEMTSAMERFCDGVNEYILRMQGRLPPEFTILGYTPEPWEPTHCANLVGYMAWDLTVPNRLEAVLHKIRQQVTESKFRQLLPRVGLQPTTVYPQLSGRMNEMDLKTVLADQGQVLEDLGVTVFNGSNNWAVSGAKSVTGKPILANDMHLGLNAPGLWYQMHQTVKNGLNVTGVVLPGQPFVICGHNDRMAWGMTNVKVDALDFYLEKINPDNPEEYEFKGEFKPFTVRHETIHVKGGKRVEKQLRFTHRGPVFSGFKKIKDQTITMKWIGNEYSNEVRGIYLLNRAGNWEEFKDALKTFLSVSQNVNYADVDGNIGIYCAAGIPIRRKGDGMAVSPGGTDEYDWQGLVPFEQLPHVYNPPEGFVSSANNKSVPDSYPYHISHWYALNYRIDRIREMLSRKQTLSIDDFSAMHGDVQSVMARMFMPFFLERIGRAQRLTPIQGEALRLLETWDGHMGKQSGAAAVFEVMYVNLVKGLIADELGEDLYEAFAKTAMLHRYFTRNVVLDGRSDWSDDVSTAGITETLDQAVVKSFKAAVSFLTEQMGDSPDQWEWGHIHQLGFKHPLGRVKILDLVFRFNTPPRPVGGSFHTVCPPVYRVSNPFEVIQGASHRHIYSAGNWDDSLSVLPTGTSGIPASDHYRDQTGLYMGNQYHRDLFGMDQVKVAARYRLQLLPQ
jgi:penicillin amidase